MLYRIMKNYILSLTIVLGLLFSCTTKNEIPKPPLAPKQPTVDEYFGQKIEDPYRNLENLEDSTIINWFKAQDNYARNILNNIPKADELYKKIETIESRTDFTIGSVHITDRGSVFYTKTLKNDKNSKLYYKEFTDAREEVLLFDPSNYKTQDKIEYHISYFKPNWDGSAVAIAVSKEGDEIAEIIFIQTENGQQIAETLTHTDPGGTGGIQWLPDNSGIIYQHFQTTDHKDPEFYLDIASVIYKLEDKADINTVIFSRKHNTNLDIEPADFPIIRYDKKWGNYIIGSLSGVNSFEDTYIAEIENENYDNLNWKLLFKEEDKVAQYDIIKDSLYFISEYNADYRKICKTSVLNPDFKNPEVLIPEQRDIKINDFRYLNDKLYYSTQRFGIEAKVYAYSNGETVQISTEQSPGRISLKNYNDQLYALMTTWNRPVTWYILDPKRNTFRRSNVKPEIDYPEFKDITSEVVYVKSHDDEIVPMTIIYNKGLELDGKNSTMLLGYGSYGTTYSTFFYTQFMIWISEGGIIAIPHVRGGGAKGDSWHKAGFKTTKPNTWKDAIACTEYLIEKKYTSAQHTLIFGISAGGILLGRAITERPDLYAAAIGSEAFINAMRSEFQVSGPDNVKEFGTVKDSSEFRALYEMDAYHHIGKDINYPATLFSTGMKDQRVPAWDPAKFIARLQEYNTSEKPVMMMVNFNRGHLVNISDSEFNKEMAQKWAFGFWQTGHPDYQPE